MLVWLLCAQLAASAPRDSVYSTPALRAFVAAAAAANRRPPPTLAAYTDHVESELSLLVRDTLGREHTAQIEQFAAAAHWRTPGTYYLHLVGYRSQSIGAPYSSLSLVRAWTVPMLYGERLSLGAYFHDRPDRDSLFAVHPFAEDRDRFYTFTGGDTIATLHAGDREIRVVRVVAHPHFSGPTRLAAFDGEIDVDATSHAIIRMRGQFEVLGGTDGFRTRMASAIGIVAVAYIEFVNAEVDGRYWLPSYQRSEFQASFPMLSQDRPIFRIVSTFSDVRTTVDSSLAAPRYAERVTLSWAPQDSVSAFTAWERDIGDATAGVHADDFADLAPSVWRVDGPPRLDMLPTTTSRMLRFNRVEGLFTGVAPTLDLRDAAPGLSVGGYVGWAWTEQTARGGAFVSYHPSSWIVGARAERVLATTNDFVPPLANDPGLLALLGSVDDYDYVDRRTAAITATRIIGSVSTALLTTELSVDRDANERARLTRGLIPGPTPFRANRNAADRSYVLSSTTLEVHPDVTGDYVAPGVGVRAHYEVGSGELDWQRAELSLSARRYWGPVSLAAHADGGVLLGAHPPPQTLFELGGGETLAGYAYKEFAGDRAALFRAFATYRFPLWKTPRRIWRHYYLPGLGPGLAVSAAGGWTEISSPGAMAAVQALGPAGAPPVSRATGGVVGTVGAGITLFSDVLHMGVARPVAGRPAWRLVVGFGPEF